MRAMLMWFGHQMLICGGIAFWSMLLMLKVAAFGKWLFLD
jgi:hypothetical protein